MSNFASTERSRSESSPKPSDSRDSPPAYRFFFGPAEATTSTRDDTDIRNKYLLPDVLLGISANQRKVAFQGVSLPVGSSGYTGSPPTSSSTAARTMVSDGAQEIENQIEIDAQNRHYIGLYEMQTNTAADRSAKEVMASSEVREAFRLLNEAQSNSETESLLVDKIEKLDRSVRCALGLAGSDYGGLMKIEKYPMTRVS